MSETTDPVAQPETTCRVPECGKPAARYTRGLCYAHARQVAANPDLRQFQLPSQRGRGGAAAGLARRARRQAIGAQAAAVDVNRLPLDALRQLIGLKEQAARIEQQIAELVRPFCRSAG